MTTGSWDDEHAPDGPLEGARKMRNLLRYLAVVMAVPAWTIALAYLLFSDPGTHVLHLAVYSAVGVAAVTLFVLAPRLGRRWSDA